MSQSTGAAIAKMDVCEKCGDRGDTKRLVYCVKCQVSSQHRYCMDILPGGGKKVKWTCEECSPRDAKPRPIPSIKSARISEAVETRMNRIKLRKQTSFSRVYAQAKRQPDWLTTVKKPTGDCSPKKEIERLPSLCDGSPKKEIEKLPPSSPIAESEEFRKPKRRLVLEDEFEPTKHSKVDPWHLDHSVCAQSLNISCMSYPEPNYVHAQPISDPIWRGCLSIKNNKKSAPVRLVAHLSSQACAKVVDATKQLPTQLNVDIFSRSDAWPQKFEIAPPTDASIALYFFPECERDEKIYDNVMNHIIDNDQALKTVINNVELLFLSSRVLPPEYWRFSMKYFLWGVFKPIKNLVPEIAAKYLQ